METSGRFRVGLVLVLIVALSMAATAVGAAEDAGCADGPSSWSGTVSNKASQSYTVDLCSDPTADLMVALNWRNAKRDLRLTVTDPEGNVTIVDGHDPQPYEVFAASGPLPEGTWTFTVENSSRGNVKHTLWARFD